MINKIKAVAWGILTVAAVVIGAIVFGKFKKLKKFETEARVKKADADLDVQVDKHMKSKKKAEDSYEIYINKLTAYRDACAKRDKGNK